MTTATPDEREAFLAPARIEELAIQFKGIVDIRDRTYGLPPKKYARCFVGQEAVAAMIRAGIANDGEDAVSIGNLLLQAGVLHHVQRAHPFADKYLFYRFSEDEDHGTPESRPDGSAVKWSDFIPPMNASTGPEASLQASIPERDPRLADFQQEYPAACGIAPLDEHNAALLDRVHPKAWVDPVPKPAYNLVVIGAGTGGLVSAAGAAGIGARVALVESHLMGGDCLNLGCVPSKALLRCAKVAAAVRDAARFGVHVQGEVSVDFEFIMRRLRRLRAAIAASDSAERFTRKLGVDVFMGRARFTGRKTVEVNGQTLKFAKAVVATGGTAAIPDIPGLGQAPYLTNATIFNLTRLPPRLGVIGAGPIGIELAQAFQRLGSRVTVFSRGGGILPKEDPAAAAVVEEALRRDGVTFLYHVQYNEVTSRDGQPPLSLRFTVGREAETMEFDALLVAAGRKPAVRDLGLEQAGVVFDERMGVQVNDRLQTTNPDIFAVGDVASRYQFTHVADFGARLAIRNALFFGRDSFSGLLIPWATYTDPEIAHVGLYERDLQQRGIDYTTFTRQFAEVDRSIVDGRTQGFVKIHLKKGSDRILGATIVGEHAGDMISELTVAMQAGMGLGRLAAVIHPYPTAAEAIRQCGDAYNRARLTPTIQSIFHGLMALRR